ncbi:transport permease protein [Nocardiopsis terrae]|uniref:ABC-2 type transport system permease protein n=1 Tax=Nocardiopsis terrae TaxID=372655 RepID=A0ABR9HA20_9ACTN|nr:ABC transporter permease [Nocardiopsis terrae]MBE1455874.1 ABC-2 type transport system permease protein [Nocardiopsis terrae]GHC98300.1 transport permease protein [Nocardiopsis terrae]
MNSTLNALRAGLSRGWIEFTLSFRSAQELFGYLYMPLLFLGMAIAFNSTGMADDEGHPIGAVVLSGGAAFFLVMLGVTTVLQVLANEREDGTLLRAKAVPRGLLGYTVGKSVHVAAMSVTAMALMVVPGLLFVDGFGFERWTDALILLWVCVLGMLALAPIGAIIGSFITNPRMGVTLAVLPTILIVMASGLMFPFEFMPDWVQVVGQILPVYWLGLGIRAAMLPDSYAALELAGSWQLPQVAGVLAVWALVGLVAAQWVLRRMARRESGSRVQAAREEAMKRA